MLSDLVAFCLAPFPWHLAPMGYVRELSGIGRRGAQCVEAWRPHLDASKRVILGAAKACTSRNSVLVVGSGLLLDVPLDALSATFGRVVLADIIQPRAVRRAAASHGNVELLQLDVTGVAKPVFDYVRRRSRGPLPRCEVDCLLDRAFDLVVSVNLLSQLPVIPGAYLRAKLPMLPPLTVADFSSAVIDAHLDWLARFDCRVVLITDSERTEQGGDGAVQRKDLLKGVRLPPPEETWTWDIAPRGTVYRDVAVRHRVVAYRNFQLLVAEPQPPS